MAKIKKQLLTLSGKMDQTVYVNSKRYGPHVRKAVTAGAKKDETALKTQYSRTGLLNEIASEINRIVGRYACMLKPSPFYQRLHSLLRKEPVDNRFLLLQQLAGMEVNPDYPLHKLGAFTCSSHFTRTYISIDLTTRAHPMPGKFKADCYYYAVILIVWDSVCSTAHDYCQLSEWIYIADEKPGFEFVFKRPVNSQHWLLCVQLVLGKQEERIETLKAEGMQIAGAGSFDKSDTAILQKRLDAEKRAVKKQARVKKEAEVVRVRRKLK